MVIYARLNPGNYSGWAPTALQQITTSRTTACLPVVIDDHGAAAAFKVTGTYLRQAAADVAEENAKGDTE